MKKLMKKLLAIAAAMTMAIVMAIPTMAATDGGTINITSTEQGKTYQLYRIFDMSKNDNTHAISYTINSNWTGFFAAGASGADYIVNTDSTNSLSPISVDGSTKYINITDSNVATFAQAALDYALKNSVSTVTSAQGTGAQVTVSGLTLGYYLVYPQGATNILSGNASIASLSITNKTADITPKATWPDITKKAESVENNDSVTVGQVINYEIDGTVPDTTGYTTYTYKVSDTMSTGLTFNKDVVVKVNDVVINVTPTYTTDGFTVELDAVKYTAGNSIVITYSATVNDNAVTVDKVNNTAKLTYSNTPTTTTESTSKEINNHTNKITIDKTANDANGEKLNNAVFVLKNSENKYYKYTAATSTTPAKVEWVLVENATVASLKAAADAGTITSKTTDTNGAAEFDGIPDGTYSLVEIQSPDGYNLLTESVTVDVDKDHASNTTVNQTANVINNTGSELPSTGGMGTAIFYALGAALAIGAGVILVTRKRLSK